MEYLQQQAKEELLFIEKNKGGFFSFDSYEINEAQDRYKELQKTIKKRNKELEKEREVLRSIVYPINQLNEFSRVMYTFKDALEDLTFTEAVDGMKNFKASVEGYSKLFGGAHPLAPTAVTMEQEFQAAQVGIPLKHMGSTKYEVREAELMTQLLKASGEEKVRVSRQLYNLPGQIQRDIAEVEQRQKIGKLTTQKQPFADMVRALEKFKITPGLSFERIRGVTDVQKNINLMLRKSREETTGKALLEELDENKGALTNIEYESAKANIEAAGMGKQLRGFPIWEQKGLGLDEMKEALEAGAKIASGRNDTALVNFVQKPIVTELKKLITVTEGLAERFGVDLTPQKEQKPWHERGPVGLITSLYKKLSEPKDRKPSGYSRWTGLPTSEKAFGGRVFGAGGPREDKVPAMLSSGEYVVKTDSAKKLGYASLEHINREGTFPGFQEGGAVRKKIGGRGESTSLGYFENLSKNLEEMRSVAKKLRLEGAAEVAEAIESGNFTTVPLKQAALAASEILSAPVKGLLDLFSMGEKAGKYFKKTPISDVFKDVGTGIKAVPGIAKGLVEQVKSGNLTEALKSEIASGGTGLGGLAFEMAIPSGLALKGAKKIAGKGFLKETLTSQKGAVELTGLVKSKGTKEAKELLEGAVYELGSGRYANPHATAILTSRYSDDILKQIPKGTKILDQTGAESIVLGLPGGKEVMRIGNLLPERPNIPSVLQASKRKVFGDIQVETVPKIKTKGIMETDVDFMKKKLEKTSYEFFDPRRGNLGRTKEGRLVILDPGAIRKKSAPVMAKSFTQVFEETAGEVFDPDEAGRMLKALLGEGMYEGGVTETIKKSLTTDDILKVIDSSKGTVTNKALEMGKLLKDNPKNIKAFEEAKKLNLERGKDLQRKAKESSDISDPIWDEYGKHVAKCQFFREADETRQVLLDPTTNVSVKKKVDEYLKGKIEIGDFMKFGQGGRVPSVGGGQLAIDTFRKTIEELNRPKKFESAGKKHMLGLSPQYKTPRVEDIIKAQQAGVGKKTRAIRAEKLKKFEKFKPQEINFEGMELEEVKKFMESVTYNEATGFMNLSGMLGAKKAEGPTNIPDIGYTPSSKSFMADKEYAKSVKESRGERRGLFGSILSGKASEKQIRYLGQETQDIINQYKFYNSLIKDFDIYSGLQAKDSGLSGQKLKDHLEKKRKEFEAGKIAAASLLEMQLIHDVSPTAGRFAGQAYDLRRGMKENIKGLSPLLASEAHVVKEAKEKLLTGLSDPYNILRADSKKYTEYKTWLKDVDLENLSPPDKKKRENYIKQLEGSFVKSKESGKYTVRDLTTIREEGSKRTLRKSRF